MAEADLTGVDFDAYLAALRGDIDRMRAAAAAQDQVEFEKKQDWRVKVRLAQNANYLYKGSNPGILKPLSLTNGVVFPYTPQISINYAASYTPANPTHSNYTIFQYNHSSVDQITIVAEFTCQDSFEAEYLLAVIHFFRSMTKMFYGKDTNPRAGTPPPICFLDGLGAYQFSNHPMAVSNFNYVLPQNVDYIRTTVSAAPNTFVPEDRTIEQPLSGLRLLTFGLGLIFNGIKNTPDVDSSVNPTNSRPINNQEIITYVPSKIQLTINFVPIVSRNAISNNFSLEKYASGDLMKGIQNKIGGMW